MPVSVSFAFGMPSSSQSRSRTSQTPSPLRSSGTSVTFTGSEPQFTSSISVQPSLSSSRSSSSGGVLFEGGNNSFGYPSPSVSCHADGSSGNISGPAVQLLVTGDSGPSQIPSPSVSGLIGELPGGTPRAPVSLTLSIPSPSLSSSSPSQMVSPSMSAGMLLASSESEPHASSEASGNPSLSSSSSANGGPVQPESSSGNPSPSVSNGIFGSFGYGSGPEKQTPATALIPSQNPSPSVSGSIGSVPFATSSRSLAPSPSSSKSSVRPGGARIESSSPS